MNYWHYSLMDEADDQTGGGGGGGDVTISDKDAAVDEISAGLGLDFGDKVDDDKELQDGDSATPFAKNKDSAPAPSAAEKAGAEARARAEKAANVAKAKADLTTKKLDFTGKTDDEILALAKPQPKAFPKSMKKEIAEKHWGKLDPELQDYLLQRDEEINSGFKEQGAAVNYAKALHSAIQPYEPLLKAQGIEDHGAAVKFLLNAHYILSSAPEDDRHKYMSELIKSYKMDVAKLGTLLAGDKANEPPAWAKELQDKNAALERTLNEGKQAQMAEIKAAAAKEIEAFASDPAHPYFDEVAPDITLMLNANPSLTLAQAYEKAVYANPVTRAKELSRIQEDAKEKARKEDEEKVKAALKAKGTKPKGSERERASPDLMGSMDDTLRETYRDINSRT